MRVGGVIRVAKNTNEMTNQNELLIRSNVQIGLSWATLTERWMVATSQPEWKSGVGVYMSGRVTKQCLPETE